MPQYLASQFLDEKENANLKNIRWIREQMWEPRYRPLVKVDKHKASSHDR